MRIGIVDESNLGFCLPFPVKNISELIETQLNFNTCLADVDEERRIDHFKSIQFLQYDFDKVDVAPEELTKLLQGVKHYILTTKSDGKDGRHFHLFVPVSKITSNDVYKCACDAFLVKHPLPCSRDEKAKDSVRFFWKHLGRGSIHLGQDIPMFSVPLPINRPKPRKVPYCGDIKQSSKGADWALACYCKKYSFSYDLETDGNRWESMLFVTRVLTNMEFLAQEILFFIDSHSKYEVDSKRQFTRDKVISHIEKITIK